MIIIRKKENQDIKTLAEIWLETSLKAHDFISDQYWIENRRLMEEKYLPNSEVYIAEEANNIYGFVALVGNHIASIFVRNEHQGKGIGSFLLKYVKELRPELTLNVYQKNEKSVRFYQTNDFYFLTETIDEPTGEKEITMKWKK